MHTWRICELKSHTKKFFIYMYRGTIVLCFHSCFSGTMICCWPTDMILVSIGQRVSWILHTEQASVQSLEIFLKLVILI